MGEETSRPESDMGEGSQDMREFGTFVMTPSPESYTPDLGNARHHQGSLTKITFSSTTSKFLKLLYIHELITEKKEKKRKDRTGQDGGIGRHPSPPVQS